MLYFNNITYTFSTVHFLYSTLSLQYTFSAVLSLQYTFSTVHFLYSTLSLQYFLYSTLSLQYILYRTFSTVHFLYRTLSLQMVPLHASIAIPQFELSKTSLDFGVCLVGQQREQEFIIANHTSSHSFWTATLGGCMQRVGSAGSYGVNIQCRSLNSLYCIHHGIFIIVQWRFHNSLMAFCELST